MNVEQSPLPEVDRPPPPAAPRAASRSGLWMVLAVLALVLAGWQWFETRQKLLDLQQEVARRLSGAESAAKAEAGADRQLREQMDSLLGRLSTLEERLAESRDQEDALKALYQDVARGREEAELLEIEQAITLAVQQIQLAGNVPVALLALRSADAQLARLDKARHLPLRRALAADIERLNTLPLADVPGISLRLEQVVGSIDKLPLAIDGRPETTLLAIDPPAKPLEPGAEPGEVPPWWRIVLSDAWQEVKTLVRIQRFDREEPVLLAPGQRYFLRENIRLRLLNARLALFARDQWTFRNELNVARAGLERHFATEDKAVQAALATLKSLAAAEIVIELPNLSASQQALVNLRDAKDKR